MFVPTALDNVGVDLYTLSAAPASQLLVDAGIRLMNPTASPRAVSIYLIPSGDSADAGNIFLDTYSLPANETKDLSLSTLSAGGKIHGLVDSGTDVIVHAISATLYTP